MKTIGKFIIKNLNADNLWDAFEISKDRKDKIINIYNEIVYKLADDKKTNVNELIAEVWNSNELKFYEKVGFTLIIGNIAIKGYENIFTNIH